MCFSMEASFAASAILLTTGTVAIIKARKTPMRYFAAIPLFFGIQQAIEGFQWLVDKPSLTSTALGYGFLFFAFLVWPVYTPFSIMMMEPNAKRKQLLKAITFVGAAVSFYLLAFYLTSPLEVCVVENSIVYKIFVPFLGVGLPLYAFATCSSFLSTRSRARLLGVTTLGGLLVSLLAYRYAFTSVWCFFAAILSVSILAEILHPSISEHRRHTSSKR